MRGTKRFGEHLATILTHMCKIVGANAKKVDFKEKDWYWGYTWTAQKQEEFTKWMEEYLLKEKEARKEIMHWPRKNKKDISTVVQEFVFEYGWKNKES